MSAPAKVIELGAVRRHDGTVRDVAPTGSRILNTWLAGSRILNTWLAGRKADRAAQAGGAGRYGRAYVGAKTDLTTINWLTANTSINADLQAALPTLRARSRDLCANTPLGRRFLTLVRNNVVGPHGLRFQSMAMRAGGDLDTRTNDAIEAWFADWSRKEHCDIAQRRSFPALCRGIVAAVARDGEALVRKVRGTDAGPHGFALQWLEADRLDHGYHDTLRNGNAVRMGVETDTRGRHVAYHVLTYHPGEDVYGGKPRATRERVPASDMLLVMTAERAEQVRGVPWMHAVLIDAKMLAGFEEAAVVAARAGASKFGWLKQTEPGDASGNAVPDFDEVTSGGGAAMNFEAGSIGTIPFGWDFGSFNPDYPSQAFDPFVKAVMHRHAAGLDVAHHNLSGRMDGVNYSSARIAELNERDGWTTLQQWFIDELVAPVAAEALMFALLNGRVTTAGGAVLPAENFERYRKAMVFEGRGWDWVDPRNEVESNAKAIETGLDSRTAIAARQGRNFEDVVKNLKREREMLAAAGLLPAAPAAPADPEPDADDTPNPDGSPE